MVVRVAQLVYNCVQEAKAGLVVKCLHDLLEYLPGLPLLLSLVLWLLARFPIGDEEHDCAYNVRVDPSAAIHNLVRLLHFPADFSDQMRTASPCVVL